MWDTPTGHTYITKPEGAHWYPQLAQPTGTPEITDEPVRTPGRGYCMPKRKQPRAQERQQLINEARMANEERIASEESRRLEREKVRAIEENWDEPAPF